MPGHDFSRDIKRQSLDRALQLANMNGDGRSAEKVVEDARIFEAYITSVRSAADAS